MRALAILPSMAVVFILIGAGSAQEKKATNKEKIIGKWEVVKATEGVKAKVGDIAEFTKDGKSKTTYVADKEVVEATYEIDGDTLKEKHKDQPVAVLKIKTLTEKTLIVEGENAFVGRVTIEFKKK